MNYAQLRNMDIANGEGIRVSLFASGCTHNCKGCFNADYQNFNYGDKMSFEVTEKIISLISQRQYRGLTLLGGEPFQNLELSKYIKPVREFIDEYNSNLPIDSKQRKDIWTYSGYTYEQILADEEKLKLLELCDVLIDGLFKEELINLKLKFRGSANQRIIDVKKSLSEKKPVLYYGKQNI